MASFLAFLVFAGSIYMFVNLFKENQFKQSAKNLINDIKKSGVSIIDEKDEDINYNNKSVKIYVYGKKLSAEEINSWNAKLPEYRLKDTKLIVQQGADDSDLRHDVKNLTELYMQNQQIISSRDESLREKEAKIELLETELSKFYNTQIPFKQISQEAQINYSDLKQLSYAKMIKTNFKTVDTITIFNAEWDATTLNKANQEKLLKKWLKIRLNLDSLVLNNR
ncbi:hypothetical protein [Lutibacter sp.]|uniref:hypothetical protein n=1 Tax=Lutibacter sp. TaxID=1925666 RepID=UPI00273470CE|nr:hypothetical protein [Lutibacter sp.]MDP3313028.1 hypothetical protein [Lutibacter sp.]